MITSHQKYKINNYLFECPQSNNFKFTVNIKHSESDSNINISTLPISQRSRYVLCAYFSDIAYMKLIKTKKSGMKIYNAIVPLEKFKTLDIKKLRTMPSVGNKSITEISKIYETLINKNKE